MLLINQTLKNRPVHSGETTKIHSSPKRSNEQPITIKLFLKDDVNIEYLTLSFILQTNHIQSERFKN